MASILSKYGFHEWLCKSHFSFLIGASSPAELVSEAAKSSYKALCVNDYDGVYGLARIYREVQRQCEFHLKLNYSAEIHLQKDHDKPLLLQDTLVLGARTWKGYYNLCQLLSYSHREGKLYAQVPSDYLLTANLQDVFAILPMRGTLREHGREISFLGSLKEHLNGSLYFAVSRHFHPSEDYWIPQTLSLAKQLGSDCLISQDAFFHARCKKPLSDILQAIRTNQTLDNCKEHMFPNSERCLHSLDYLENTYRVLPVFEEALKASRELNESCDFCFSQLRYRYPKNMIPKGHTAQSYLYALVRQGIHERYGDDVPRTIHQALNHELQLIERLQFADYFLTVWDIVSWARSQNILCQGRGSAANSAVCFVLGITAADPNKFHLLFERFISPERGDPPDIDVDFEHERREEVVQYIYQRYGRQQAAMVANVITFRRKGSLRAVGKALGAPEEMLGEISQLVMSKYLRSQSTSVIINELQKKSSWSEQLPHFPWQLLLELSEQLRGFPRHLGIHSGGFILSDKCLHHLVAQEPATMEGRTVIQWCKEDIEGLGFFKIDILCLGMLTAVRKCFDLVEKHYGHKINFYEIPEGDVPTYQMISQGETVGTFQIESRAQMTMLPRLRPQKFYDLVVQIAIIRPGPIQGKVVHPFLARRQGKAPVEFPDPRLQPILQRTLGVPIFQEQLMEIAITVGDFTPGEANELRKNIGAWNIKEFERDISPWLLKLKRGMEKNGFKHDFIEQILGQMRGFAEYGFPESHAISFAFIAYASSYLKRHYPAAFFTSVLNSQPMGFYSAHTLLQTARREGVEILPISINQSHWDHTLENFNRGGKRSWAIRLGLRLIKGLSKTGALRVLEDRKHSGPWHSIESFAKSTFIQRNDFTALAAAQAFNDLNMDRSQALWYAEANPFPPLVEVPEKSIQWRKENEWETLQRDLKAFSTTLGKHPVEIFKQKFWPFQVAMDQLIDSQQLMQQKNKMHIEIFGMVMVRQSPPTAKGMVFITLEDHKGFINLVFTPDIYARYYSRVEKQGFLCVSGEVQKVNNYVSILVKKVYEAQANSITELTSVTQQFTKTLTSYQ